MSEAADQTSVAQPSHDARVKTPRVAKVALAIVVVILVGSLGADFGFHNWVVSPEQRRIEAAELDVERITPALRAIPGAAVRAGVPKRSFGYKAPSWFVSVHAYVLDKDAEAAVRSVAAGLRVPPEKVQVHVDPCLCTPEEMEKRKREAEIE